MCRRWHIDLHQWSAIEIWPRARGGRMNGVGPMPAPDFKFAITREVQVDIEFRHKRAVILCRTTNGKSLHLEADLDTLDALQKQIIAAEDRL
jgi:hypothetical protein